MGVYGRAAWGAGGPGANAVDESVDAESGTNLRIECMQCFESFAIPEGVEVRFE